MGASIVIKGIRNLDEKFTTMYNLLRSCVEAGVSIPPEVKEYFKPVVYEGYDIQNMKREDAKRYMAETNICFDGNVEYGDGALIDLSKIPSDVTKIRIFMEV